MSFFGSDIQCSASHGGVIACKPVLMQAPEGLAILFHGFLTSLQLKSSLFLGDPSYTISFEFRYAGQARLGKVRDDGIM